MSIWLIIALVMLVAFGPILWLKPSSRDRRLVLLRETARRAGLVVEVRRLPLLDPDAEDRVSAGGVRRDASKECAVYFTTVPRKLHEIPTFRVLRGRSGRPAIAIAENWVFDPTQTLPAGDAWSITRDWLVTQLPRAPKEILGLQFDGRLIGGYWLEGKGSTPEQVLDLSRFLSRLATALVELDQTLTAQEGDDDS